MDSGFVYDNARAKFLSSEWDWAALPVYAALLSADYVPAFSHTNLSEVSAGARIVSDLELTGLGMNADRIVYGIIPETAPLASVHPVAALLLYSKGVDDEHSPLIYYSAAGAGFPFTPAGLNYYVAYDRSKGGFFKIPEIIPPATPKFTFIAGFGGGFAGYEEGGIGTFVGNDTIYTISKVVNNNGYGDLFITSADLYTAITLNPLLGIRIQGPGVDVTLYGADVYSGDGITFTRLSVGFFSPGETYELWTEEA